MCLQIAFHLELNVWVRPKVTQHLHYTKGTEPICPQGDRTEPRSKFAKEETKWSPKLPKEQEIQTHKREEDSQKRAQERPTASFHHELLSPTLRLCLRVCMEGSSTHLPGIMLPTGPLNGSCCRMPSSADQTM